MSSNSVILKDNLQSMIGVFALLFFCAMCCSGYCCRRVNPTDLDPATEENEEEEKTMEQKRDEILNKLILKKVIELEDSQRDIHAVSFSDHSASSFHSGSGRSWISNRCVGTYVDAIMTRRSASHRVIRFSEQLSPEEVKRNHSDYGRSRSDPQLLDFSTTEAETTATSATATIKTETNNKNKQDVDQDHQGEDHHHHHNHRRKTDVLVRTLAVSLRSKPMDYAHPTTCDICLMDYEAGEEVAWSPNDACEHAFHKECIVDWILRNPKCPLCRNDYLHDSSKKKQEGENENV
eukprot:CAMPEP_0116843644 /NCGR_PEP_ID=MMETSP0418-20121206/12205_1 /TAXON_ID=1158023 /ORGANISM="Astrosyne radiata, Strain 13vi08-1A" /LENGTH=291 /DNA_ID=CAMNT_0004474425 /DNA_START=154 /DNA_END=1029 /DNA_ORIENTATION=-